MKIMKKGRWAIALVLILIITATAFNAVTTSAANDTGGSSANINYTVEFSGIGPSDFISVEMPEALIKVIEFQDGDDPVLHKRPGVNSCSNMVITSDPSNTALDGIWDWFQNVRSGQYDRRSAVIILSDSHGQVLAKYTAMGTWPCEWRVVTAEDKGMSDTVVVEIEFIVEELYRMP